MRKDSVVLEEGRLGDVGSLDDYPWFKERHRVFPAVFEGRNHRRILDVAAGAGCAAQRIHNGYPAQVICNEISPSALRLLRDMGLATVSFDLDDERASMPFADGSFDAVVSLVTIEHLLHPDHHLNEIRRVLSEDGFLYIAAPNYAAPEYVLPMLLSGRAVHNPLDSESRYEFYSHVRYFTYRTLLEVATSLGFVADTVYLALPGGSARFRALQRSSALKARTYRWARWLQFRLLPARLATEPILCLRRGDNGARGAVRKVVL
ncbi:MAG: class I SAM-dependent methyltransferase [Anaerolineae bacterium]|nr:class I SAM-dependent methyltransferase [Anaerolineae bacterium]